MPRINIEAVPAPTAQTKEFGPFLYGDQELRIRAKKIQTVTALSYPGFVEAMAQNLITGVFDGEDVINVSRSTCQMLVALELCQVDDDPYMAEDLLKMIHRKPEILDFFNEICDFAMEGDSSPPDLKATENSPTPEPSQS